MSESPPSASQARAQKPLELGTAIRIARQFNRMSQRDIVKAAEVSQSLYSEVERGHKHPSLETLEAIAAALHMTPGSLYLLAESMAGRPSENALRHLASIKRWLADTAHLDPDAAP